MGFKKTKQNSVVQKTLENTRISVETNTAVHSTEHDLKTFYFVHSLCSSTLGSIELTPREVDLNIINLKIIFPSFFEILRNNDRFTSIPRKMKLYKQRVSVFSIIYR